MNILTLKILRAPDPKHGPKRRSETTFTVHLTEPLTFDQARSLIEAEQALNSLPANLRVHIGVDEVA